MLVQLTLPTDQLTPTPGPGIQTKRVTETERESSEECWQITMERERCEMMGGDGDNSLAALGKVTGGSWVGTDL